MSEEELVANYHNRRRALECLAGQVDPHNGGGLGQFGGSGGGDGSGHVTSGLVHLYVR